MIRVLVVDDLAVFREPIAASLRASGFEVSCAADGRQALAAVRSVKPHIILLDVAMPNMDGLEFLRRFREDATVVDCPVILLTAVAERDYVLRAAKLGVRDYLLKSQFSLRELDERIRKVVAARGSDAILDDARLALPTVPVRCEKRESPVEPTAETTCKTVFRSVADRQAGLAELRPLMKRSEVMERIAEGTELHAMSPTVAEVLKLTRSTTATAEQVAGVIKRDQAIALKILQLANSSAYSRGDRVDTVERAVIRIGMGAIGQAVLNVSVIDNFSEDAGPCGLDLFAFWEHSIATALLGAEIAHAIDSLTPDLAFTLGLLHDVGRLIYAQICPEEYARVLETAAKLDEPLECVEARMMLYGHADAMDRVLHAWSFPKDLIDPIVFHHLSIGNIRKTAAKRLFEVATLALANRLAHAMLMGSSGNDAVYPTEDLCRALRIDGDLFDSIIERVPSQTADLKICMLAAGARTGAVDRLQQTKDEIGAPLRPMFFGTNSDIDAHRVLCERIAHGGGEPNLIVAHISDVRDRAALGQCVREADLDAHERLPLVLISPSGSLMLEECVMEGRTVILLPTPMTLSRFVKGVRLALGRDRLKSDRKAA